MAETFKTHLKESVFWKLSMHTGISVRQLRKKLHRDLMKHGLVLKKTGSHCGVVAALELALYTDLGRAHIDLPASASPRLWRLSYSTPPDHKIFLNMISVNLDWSYTIDAQGITEDITQGGKTQSNTFRVEEAPVWLWDMGVRVGMGGEEPCAVA